MYIFFNPSLVALTFFRVTNFLLLMKGTWSLICSINSTHLLPSAKTASYFPFPSSIFPPPGGVTGIKNPTRRTGANAENGCFRTFQVTFFLLSSTLLILNSRLTIF